jgi:hypothetical protein
MTRDRRFVYATHQTEACPASPLTRRESAKRLATFADPELRCGLLRRGLTLRSPIFERECFDP